MNIFFPITAAISFLSLSVTSAKSAAILLDSFSTGGVALQADGPISDDHNLTGTGFEIRGALGRGFYGWTAFVDSQSGVFNYAVELRGTPAPSNFFLLSYSKQTVVLQLMGLDTLVMNIASLTGLGELQASFGDEPGPFAASLPINGVGDVAFRFSALFPSGWNDAVPSITIKFVPKSANFSITLGEISIVPEPSGVVLLAGTAAVWGLRRKRAMPTIPLP